MSHRLNFPAKSFLCFVMFLLTGVGLVAIGIFSDRIESN